MHIYKSVRRALAGILVLSCLCGSIQAAEQNQDYVTFGIHVQRATNQFNLKVSARRIAKAATSFPMGPVETITITASFSPSNANMDFGLMDSDGIFHYVTVTGGTINQTFLIEEWGDYTLAIRNNSSYTVSVSGFVNY